MEYFAYSKNGIPNKQTLEFHKIECPKCKGTGKVFNPDTIFELIKRWRNKLGITARTFAALHNKDAAQYSKLETGKHKAGSEIIFKMVETLKNWK